MNNYYIVYISISVILVLAIVLYFIRYPKSNSCGSTVVDDVSLNKIDYSKSSMDFSNDSIAYIEDVFEEKYFEKLKSVVNKQIEKSQVSRTIDQLSYLRKAGILSSNALGGSGVEGLYYSTKFMNLIRKVTGMSNLEVVSCDDKSNYNVLIYEKPSDHINWHYDTNNYIGKRFTVLVCIENRNANNSSLSSAELHYKLKGKDVIKFLKMKPNSILIFNGSEIYHKASGIAENERRIILSNTYCDVCKESFYGRIYRSIKDFVLNN